VWQVLSVQSGSRALGRRSAPTWRLLARKVAQGWPQQVTVQTTQSSTPALLKALLTSRRRHWSWRHVCGQAFGTANYHPWSSSKDPRNGLCFLQVAGGPLSSVYAGFLTLCTAAVQVTQLADRSTVLYLTRSIRYSVSPALLPLLGLSFHSAPEMEAMGFGGYGSSLSLAVH